MQATCSRVLFLRYPFDRNAGGGSYAYYVGVGGVGGEVEFGRKDILVHLDATVRICQTNSYPKNKGRLCDHQME